MSQEVSRRHNGFVGEFACVFGGVGRKSKPDTKNLIRCGIDKNQSWMWANTRKGYWCIAGSPIVSRAINNDNLRKAGYLSLSDYYRKVTS